MAAALGGCRPVCDGTGPRRAAERTGVIAAARNFYGVLKVVHSHSHFGNLDEGLDELRNGRIVHGREYTNPQHRKLPTAYYGPDSGIGRLLLATAGGRPRRVGIIGLGVGTLAAYAQPGDSFRFYEINPMVEQMARQYFHYLGDCAGRVNVVLGDARLNLDREKPQNFDVLVLDAFSGDAIPMHLLTVEAFAIYLRHLAPEGVIAVHISNQHFSLGPVVDAVSHAHQLEYTAVLLEELFVWSHPEFVGARCAKSKGPGCGPHSRARPAGPMAPGCFGPMTMLPCSTHGCPNECA